MAVQRRSIPANFRPVDAAAYGSGSGAPTHAGLLTRLPANSRRQAADLRRSWFYSFDAFTPHLAVESLGLDLGVWPLDISPGCREIEWQVTAELTGDWTAVGYTLGEGSAQPLSADLFSQAGVLWSAGGGYESYSVTCPVREGSQLCGVALRGAEQNGASTLYTYAGRGYGWLQATAAIAATGTPPAWVVRLTVGVAAPAIALSDWHQVVRRRTTDPAVANDTVEIWPHLTDHEYRAIADKGAAMGIELQPSSQLELYSITVIESRPTVLP
jgi:hypothetical protein